MARRFQRPVSADIAELISLVVSGRLFAVQEWISSGKKLRDPEIEEREQCALWKAVDSGFHSMVEILLKAGGWSQEELNDGFYTAMSNGRLDLVDLLMEHGGSVQAIDFEHVCRTVKPELIERFLRAGVDPSKDNAFARALNSIKARPLLRFYKSMRAEFPALDDQAALALSEAVKEKKTGWVALLRWAGADPLRRVPDSLYDDWDSIDEEWGATAARNACYTDNEEILKVLKLKPTPEQASELLRISTHADNPAFIRAYLNAVPTADLNNGDNGGCDALDSLVSRGQCSWAWGGISNEQRDKGVISCIEELLNAGAKWRPSSERLRSTRRSLLEHDGKHIIRVVRLLLYTPDACRPEDIHELCRTPSMRQKIITADPPLWSEIQEITTSAGT